jgi:hypothetical protein
LNSIIRIACALAVSISAEINFGNSIDNLFFPIVVFISFWIVATIAENVYNIAYLQVSMIKKAQENLDLLISSGSKSKVGIFTDGNNGSLISRDFAILIRMEAKNGEFVQINCEAIVYDSLGGRVIYAVKNTKLESTSGNFKASSEDGFTCTIYADAAKHLCFEAYFDEKSNLDIVLSKESSKPFSICSDQNNN